MQKIKEFFKEPIFWFFGVAGGIMATCTKAVFPVLPQQPGEAYNYKLDLFNLENIIVFIISTLFFYTAIHFIYKGTKKLKPVVKTKNRCRSRKVFLIVLTVCLIVFTVAFLVYYPGLGMNDTLVALHNFVDNNQHPPVFQAIVFGVFHAIKNITGSANVGYATLTIFQIVAASGIIAYFVSWLHSHKIIPWIIVLVAIFLIGSPLVSDYTIAILKDTWFAYAILLLLPNLYDFITRKSPSTINKVLLIISLAGVWLSRSNGRLITIILCLTLLAIFFKNKSKRILLLISTAVFLVVGFCINQVVANRITKDYTFRETISVPLAQIGAVVNSSGELSQEDKDNIEKLLPVEKWGDNYRFSFVDTIKFDDDFDNTYLLEHKGEFFKTWFSIMIKNPGIYFRTYLFQTYGLWNLAYWDTNNIDMAQSLYHNLMNNISKENPEDSKDLKEWMELIKLSNHSLLSPELTSLMDDYYQTTASTNVYLSAGVMILICLSCVAIVIKSKRYLYLIIFLPIFLTWGSMMISSPASMIYRYNFYMLLSLPFVIVITILSVQKNYRV